MYKFLTIITPKNTKTAPRRFLDVSLGLQAGIPAVSKIFFFNLPPCGVYFRNLSFRLASDKVACGSEYTTHQGSLRLVDFTLPRLCSRRRFLISFVTPV